MDRALSLPAFTLDHLHPLALMRFAIVSGCALSLILAGKALPF